MERARLEEMLEEGLSLAEIGRRVGRHEATVAYWVQKHGLRAANAGRHSARGPLDQGELARLVEAGLSCSEIAAQVGRSKTTVRHWLREYGMQTRWAERRRASANGEERCVLSCSQHGMTEFRRREPGGYRCTKCRAEAVTRRRRRVKMMLVAEAGGCCVHCGYSRCPAALGFHHVDPATNRFSLSHRGVARAYEKARAEAAKCILLCANCHAEVEAGFLTLTEPPAA